MLKTLSCIVKNDDIIDRMLHDSLVLYDQILYYQRKKFFETRDSGKVVTYSYNQLWEIVKNTDTFKNIKLDNNVKQYVIRQIAKVWKGYMESVKSYKKNNSLFTGKPKLPNYLYKRKNFNIIYIDNTRFKKRNPDENSLMVPCSNYKIYIPKQIKLKDVRQISIQKFYGKTKINFIYEDKEVIRNKYDENSAIGIDLGVNNLCAITSNDKRISYVINGRPLKSINQFYNKKLAKLKSQLEICNSKKTSKQIERLHEKRHNKILNYFHNVSKRIIDICLENNIETIVIGHSKGWKQNCNIGKVNNQNFMQIPFNILIDQIKYKASKYTDLKVICTEESYTSKCDHLAKEEMRHHDVYLGSRVKRGLFKSSIGKTLNADINGAIGMLRKANAITDEQLMLLRDRGDVVSPMMLNLLTHKHLYK